MTEPLYRIGTLARLTGVTTHALRVWERRYRAFEPKRTPKGARLYSDADVDRVRLIKLLIERGHTISGLVALSPEQLRELITESNGRSAAQSDSGADAEAVIESLVAAVTSLEVEAASRVLARAALIFSPRDLALNVLGPLLERVGELWGRGELRIASEHAVSALLRTQLGQFLNSAPAVRSAPIVCTTPAGERHELGVLLAAVMIALGGRRALYLGPDLPADQIAEAARVSRAAAVALSVVSLDPALVRAELDTLLLALPAHVEVLIGGHGARTLTNLPPRVRLMQSLPELESWLEGLN